MVSTAAAAATTSTTTETTPLLEQGGSGSSGAAALITTTSSSAPGWILQLDELVNSRSNRRWNVTIVLINALVIFVQSILLSPHGGGSANNSSAASAAAGRPTLLIEYGYYFQWGVVALYSIDYLMRLIVAVGVKSSDAADAKGNNFFSRLFKYVTSFWSLVDLASIIPFVVWATTSSSTMAKTTIAAAGHQRLPISLRTTTWIRVFRLLKRPAPSPEPEILSRGRVGLRVKLLNQSSINILYDVIENEIPILGTAAFVGITTWIAVSALYYLAERRNLNMIYCPCDTDTVDVANDCSIDYWGLVNCTIDDNNNNNKDDCNESCYNLYESIPMASYYTLLNLFGEFPLLTIKHTVGGMVVGTITAVVAVAVFALPVGIIGNGFAGAIEQRQRLKLQQQQQQGGAIVSPEEEEESNIRALANFYATDSTFRGRCYNFWFARTTPFAKFVNHGINVLVLITCLTYMYETTITSTEDLSMYAQTILNSIEFFTVVVFTVEYVMRLYSVVENPKYDGNSNDDGSNSQSCRGNAKGRWEYAQEFLPVVDLLSFLPFWISCFYTGGFSFTTMTTSTDTSSDGGSASFVATLRLLRIFRFEQYTQAFTTFDNVFMNNMELLAVTAAVAVVLWILLGFALYYTEVFNPDTEMAENYSNIPNSMWITLLNLSGESPLCQYSAIGKVITGLLGLFATGVFGIPIGVLGSGFEEIVAEEHADNTEELEQEENTAASDNVERSLDDDGLGSPIEQAAYRFVNGLGGWPSRIFEASIYFLIFLVVGVGIWQTVDGHEDDCEDVEIVSVVIFTIEYLIRLVGVGADPQFQNIRNPILKRLRFIVSFYSIVDLLAIVPLYLAMALPNSIVDQYDEYLRMIRILRLVKLDKYVPSITLLDDVIRLKFNSLRVALYAALTLWIVFTALLFLCEHSDSYNELDDPVPDYGCDEDCTMLDRFQNFFDSMVYTGIHLTGDYPIITYNLPAKVVNFFMVVAAVGVVSIPSGLIASGFVEIVQSKNCARHHEAPHSRAGDDWYEHRYRALEGVDPPPSKCGPSMDRWQIAVNEFLNGKEGEDGKTQWSTPGFLCRIFIFTVIIANVFAVLLESIPAIDKAVGNQPGNFFDVFEMLSVMVFACEYIARLFCAPKNREALYSSWIYATTFFGIVDLLSTAPWFVEQALIASGLLDAAGDNAKIFRIFRIFRILQLEDFVTAFSKLDNVFRASKDVLKATGLLALIIWIGCGALFFIFEENNPNWRTCDESVPLRADPSTVKMIVDEPAPGCFDFKSTKECNEYYGAGMCDQTAFTNMPNALYFTAVFLGGEWGVVDFTWPGRFVCLFLCVIGIALYAIPVGTLFDSFGAVLGLVDEDDEEEEEGEEGDGEDKGNDDNDDKVTATTSF